CVFRVRYTNRTVEPWPSRLPSTTDVGVGSVVDEARHRAAAQPLASLQEIQLDQKCDIDDGAASRFEQRTGRFGRPAGRQEIIDERDALAGLNRITMQLDGRLTVFELVGALQFRRGQLAGFPHRYERRTQFESHGRREKEAARLDAGEDVDPHRLEVIDEQI